MKTQSPFGDIAGLLQLLPMLSKAGGGMDDISSLAQLSMSQQEQQQRGQYQDQRNQLYEQSIAQRQQAAEQARQQQMAEFALKQQAEQRQQQDSGYRQKMGMARLGLDTQNADVNNIYKQLLMESISAGTQGKLQQQQLLQQLLMGGQAQPTAQPAGPGNLSPAELQYLQQLPR